MLSALELNWLVSGRAKILTTVICLKVSLVFIFNRDSRRDLLIQPFVCSQESDQKMCFQCERINSGSSYDINARCGKVYLEFWNVHQKLSNQS